MSKHNGIIEEEDEGVIIPENFDYLTIISGVIKTISQILEDLINENIEIEAVNSEELIQSSLKAFFVKKQPNKPLLEYFQRIIKYAKPEPSSVIISLIYIDKLCENTDLHLSFYNIHRLILTNGYYSNTYYARVGGISIAELNGLEYELLQALDFIVYVDDEIYSKYEAQLLQTD